MNIQVRRYKDGDAPSICEMIRKDVMTENIKDYSEESIKHLIEI